MINESNKVELDSFPSCLVSSNITFGALERAVCAVSSHSGQEEIVAMIEAADWVLTRAKSIQYLSQQIAMKWIDRNGEFNSQGRRYSVGFKSTVRCKNAKRSGLQILKALSGDLEQFMDLLIAQPYKTGTANRVLSAEVFRETFTVKRNSRLNIAKGERHLRISDATNPHQTSESETTQYSEEQS